MMRRALDILTLMAAACLLAACSVIDSPVPCPGPSDNVTMSFRMFSGNIRGTRDDDRDHVEVGSEYDKEDAIDPSSFGFFIFVGSGNDAKMLTAVTDIFRSSDPFTMITGGSGSYTVTLTIPKSELAGIMGRELNQNSTDSLYFRVVTLANTYPFRLTELPQVKGETTYGAFMTEADNITFGLVDELYEESPAGSDVTGMYKGYIPMFGNKVFSVTEGELFRTRPEDRIWMGETNLLRSVAKIRVRDNIANRPDGSVYPCITAAYVNSTTDTLYVLPADAVGYKDGWQVHKPRVHAGARTNFQLGYLPNDNSMRIGYVPEQIINGNVNYFTVRVQYSENEEESKDFTVPMAGEYKGQTMNFGTSILRNHIYTLNVVKAEIGAPAEITLNVEDWTESSLNLDYDKNVGVSNTIDWTEGYQSDNTTDGELVLRPWDSEPVPAVCTFGLSSPENATWTASLLVTEGTPGAFMFLDADGNQVPSISGTVDGKLSSLRVVSVNPTPSVTSKAILQITVQLANGQYIEANVCGNKGYKNYTIIQNQQ